MAALFIALIIEAGTSGAALLSKKLRKISKKY